MSRPVIPLRRLWFAVLFGYLAMGASLQLLPTLVVHRFGGSPVLVGIAVGLAFAGTAAGRPFAGHLADQGRARPVVGLGGLLTAVGALGQFTAPNPALLLVARLVMGVGEAALFSGALPWILTGAPADRRGRVAGWFGLSMWAGLALGPVVATVVTGLARSTTPGWLGAIGLAVASTVLIIATPPQPAPHSGPAVSRRVSAMLPREAVLPGFVLGLASYGYGTISALTVLFFRASHYAGDGAALALFAAGFLLVRAVGSPLVDRCGGAAVAGVSLLVELAGLALLAGATNPAAALVAVVLAGAGVGLMYPSTVALTLRRAGGRRPGSSLGTMTSCWDLGIMVAGPAGGLLAAGVGFRIAFGVGFRIAFGVAAALAGLAALVVRFALVRSPALALPH